MLGIAPDICLNNVFNIKFLLKYKIFSVMAADPGGGLKISLILSLRTLVMHSQITLKSEKNK